MEESFEQTRLQKELALARAKEEEEREEERLLHEKQVCRRVIS
jgi:hypothetical protein